MNARGTFQVTVNGEPPFDVVDGVSLARATIDKTFAGQLVGTSKVHMLGARTSNPESAAYVALERVTGTLAGKTGTFVLQHAATMAGGQRSLTVTVAPDSGTGELAGLSGRMNIEIVEGEHRYDLVYELSQSPR